MTAILRNNAALGGPRVGGAALGRGGSGRGARPLRRSGKAKSRYQPHGDPAAELMPAAQFLGHEPDFDAILDGYEDSPFDPARRRVLGRLMGIFAVDYQGAHSQERRFLRRLLDAGNPREGYAANRALHLCGVPHAIRRTLALGVAERPFLEGPYLGGYLGAVQARVAATTFILLGPHGREVVWDLLTRAGRDEHNRVLAGADPVLERALVLKAVGAYRHRLGPWNKEGPQALERITCFAAEIRGKRKRLLAERSCPRGGGGTQQAAGSQPPPVQHAARMARAEQDPLFAWSDQRGVVEESFTAAKQGESSVEEELPALDRDLLIDRPRLHQALAEARATGDDRLTLEQCDALLAYLGGKKLRPKRLQAKEAAMEILETRAFDVARVEAIEAIRADACGAARFDAARALGTLLGRYTGATYVRRTLADQLTAGIDPLPCIEQALGQGMAVPIVVKGTRFPNARAWVLLGSGSEAGPRGAQIDIFDPLDGRQLQLAPEKILAPLLPQTFGRQARLDAYLIPAALDLLAPPFGIPFPQLGIKDQL